MKNILLALLLVYPLFLLNAQENNNVIKLDLKAPTDIKEVKGGMFYIPKSFYAWSKDDDKEAPADSVIYRISLSGNDYPSESCADMPDGLYVLCKYEADLYKICLHKIYNPFLEQEVELNFHSDSVRKWTLENVPVNTVPRIDIKYPICEDGKIKMLTHELFLGPFNENVTYDDARFNNYPLLAYAYKMRYSSFQGNMLAFNKSDMVKKDVEASGLSIIDSLGNNYRSTIIDGIQYKSTYNLLDTIYISGSYYTIDNMANDWNDVTLRLHPDKKKKIFNLPTDILDTLTPFFAKGNEYLVIDFWGTWCAPCIESLPKLKDLYDISGDNFEFASICFDSNDKFEEAKAIFEKNGISWQQILDDQKKGNTITRKLDIFSFPTYMIVTKRGEIVLKSGGIKGFDHLKSFVTRE